MKDVHILKFKWLYNICDRLDPRDYHFLFATLPTLQVNAYGLNEDQVEELDLVYDKYKPKKDKKLRVSYAHK